VQQSNIAERTANRRSIRSNGWTFLHSYLLTPLLDLVFPPVCVGCGRVDHLLCDACLTAAHHPHHLTANLPEFLTCIDALGTFEGVFQQAVHALKYEGFTALGEPLGKLMAAHIQAATWPESLLIAVPLHPARLATRGYNQAALLTHAMAAALHWPEASDLLIRSRETTSQVGLNYQQRQENVADAFSVSPSGLIQGANIVLVDDVYTTGATIRECATALLDAGAHQIRAMVVGRAADPTAS
jgi:ComF family protein